MYVFTIVLLFNKIQCDFFKRKFVFRNIHSTTNYALVSFVELTKKYEDNDCFPCVVFIDLQKAFDRNNEILFAKLEPYGTNNWSRSLHTNRK